MNWQYPAFAGLVGLFVGYALGAGRNAAEMLKALRKLRDDDMKSTGPSNAGTVEILTAKGDLLTSFPVTMDWTWREATFTGNGSVCRDGTAKIARWYLPNGKKLVGTVGEDPSADFPVNTAEFQDNGNFQLNSNISIDRKAIIWIR